MIDKAEYADEFERETAKAHWLRLNNRRDVFAKDVECAKLALREAEQSITEYWDKYWELL